MSVSPRPLSQFSPEFQLAMACCRPGPDGAGMADIRRLLPLVDVPAFVDLVIQRQRIGPLVHAVLAKLPADRLPAGVMPPLALAARANAIKVLHAQRAHRLLANWFAASGLDWMPFKGITVAQAYYDDPVVRHVNDLDIWVPPEHLDRVRQVLQAQGCRELNSALHGDLVSRGPRHAAYLADYYHEMQYQGADIGLLELHWRLADNPQLFALSPQAVRARARRLTVAGVQVPVMDDTDLLLYLCDHGARHGWGRLKWLADLPRVLARRSWDWPEVFACADRARSRNSLLLGLGLSAEYLGWEPPEAVAAELARCRNLAPMMNLSLDFLLAPMEGQDQRLGEVVRIVMRELRMSLLLNGSMRSIALQARRYLLSPKDLQALALPDRCFAGYYLLRPLLMAGRRMGLLAGKAA